MQDSEGISFLLKRIAASRAVKVIIMGTVLSVTLIMLVSGRQHAAHPRWHAKLMPPPAECVEVSIVPVPRGAEAPWWLDHHERLSNETAEADINEGYDVLFYGDSITEMWRGSFFGLQMPFLQQVKAIFHDRFNTRYRANALGASSDEIAHLWWRLLHGNIPKVNMPKAVVLLIGTNDLTTDDCRRTELGSIAAVPGIVNRVQQVLAFLRTQMPDAHILLLGILPRDVRVDDGSPPTYAWPNRMSHAIALANYDFKELADWDDHVHFLDCSKAYIGDGALKAELFVDGIHPGPTGMDLLGACMQPTLDRLVLGGPPPPTMDAEGLRESGGATGWTVEVVNGR